MTVEVVWVFSLPRSGSSVTAYAAAAPFGVRVADEVFGPWDRTGAPYHYPRVQRELVRVYHLDECYFTPRVMELAEELFEILGAGTGKVVVKHPHLRPFPHNFRETRPNDGAVWLLRNPLKRLNSLYARGWTDGLRPNHEIDHVRAFGNHYAWAPPHCRLRFEDLRRDPHAYFRKLYSGWGWDVSEHDVAEAVRYANETYHGNSAQTGHATGVTLPTRVGAAHAANASLVSDSAWCLPDEAIHAYRRDPDMRRMFREQGYSSRPGDYRSGGVFGDLAVKLGRRGPPPKRTQAPTPPTPARAPRSPGTSRLGTRVCWIVGLPGSALDAFAQGLAACSGVPLAREPFGPWGWVSGAHAPEQRRLASLVDQARGVATPEVVAAADELIVALGRRASGTGTNGLNGTHADLADERRAPALLITSRFQRLDPQSLLTAWPASRVLYVVQDQRSRLKDVVRSGWPEGEDQDASVRRFKDMLFEIRRPRTPATVSWIELAPDGAVSPTLLARGAQFFGLTLKESVPQLAVTGATANESAPSIPAWIEGALDHQSTDQEWLLSANDLGISTPR